MRTLIYFIFKALCDNIEIRTKDFDELHVNNRIIKPSSTNYFNWVKISFPGTSVLALREIKPRVFELYDTTIYLNKEKMDKVKSIRIDFEKKYLGIADFVWKFIAYSVVVGLTSIYVIQRCLRIAFSNVFFKHPECF